jgi:hypothetical protein
VVVVVPGAVTVVVTVLGGVVIRVVFVRVTVVVTVEPPAAESAVPARVDLFVRPDIVVVTTLVFIWLSIWSTWSAFPPPAATPRKIPTRQARTHANVAAIHQTYRLSLPVMILIASAPPSPALVVPALHPQADVAVLPGSAGT